MNAEAVKDHQMSVNEGTTTDMFTCGKCKGKRCTYNQVGCLHFRLENVLVIKLKLNMYFLLVVHLQSSIKIKIIKIVERINLIICNYTFFLSETQYVLSFLNYSFLVFSMQNVNLVQVWTYNNIIFSDYFCCYICNYYMFFTFKF